MSLAVVVFVLALCLCLLAMKASQAEREENYFAKSNSRISTITSPTELRSSEVKYSRL